MELKKLTGLRVGALVLCSGLLLPSVVFGQTVVATGPSTPQQGWLKFKQEHDELAGGPAGMLAIQDMMQLDSGQTAYLTPSKEPAQARWSKEDQGGVKVEYVGDKANVSGPGIIATDVLAATGKRVSLPNGLIVRASFLKEKTLKVWLHNPEDPRRKAFAGIPFFPYDPQGVLKATFKKSETPKAVPYLDSRNQKGTMHIAGEAAFTFGGRLYKVPAYTYEAAWSEIDGVMIFLRDKTSGQATYGGGRVFTAVFPKGNPPSDLVFDLNKGYAFLCAYSKFYNCPLSLTTRIDAELKFGEKNIPHSVR